MVGESLAQVVKVVTDTMITINRVPTEPLNVNNKRFVDAVIVAVRHYVNNLKIFNYSGHISPLSKDLSKRVLLPKPADFTH